MKALSTTRQAVAQALRQAWQQRSPREQLLLSLALAVLGLATTWRVAIAPAWRTWQEAPTRQAQLDAQTQTMRQLQKQAKSLQKNTHTPRSEALQWLQTQLKALGEGAKLQLQGEQATLSVQAASPEALALWLSQARERARALPVQAQLQQVPASQTAGIRWRGTIVLRLPGQP